MKNIAKGNLDLSAAEGFQRNVDEGSALVNLAINDGYISHKVVDEMIGNTSQMDHSNQKYDYSINWSQFFRDSTNPAFYSRPKNGIPR